MKKNKISDRAVDYILTRRNEELKDLTEVKVASGIGANRSYLARCFKTDRNISLSRFVRREKIHRALFILEKDHRKCIEELAKELGFIKVDDFVREFKNQVAIEPSKYRDLRNRVNRIDTCEKELYV